MNKKENFNFKKIKELVTPVFKEYEIKGASLFGSYAQGTQVAESDIDIVINIPAGMGLFKMGSLKNDLETKLNKRVDLVSAKTIKPAFRKSILENSKPLL